MVFSPGGGSTANGRGTKFREPPEDGITSGIPPELSNLIHQVLAIERIGPLRRGDFVLRTTSLRSWTAADATHLHQTIPGFPISRCLSQGSPLNLTGNICFPVTGQSLLPPKIRSR